MLVYEIVPSMLKHNSRAKDNMTHVISDIAEMRAELLSKEAYYDVISFTKLLLAYYNQADGEETDVIAV